MAKQKLSLATKLDKLSKNIYAVSVILKGVIIMFTFTDNEGLKREIRIFQVANGLNNISEICRKMGIVPQAYYNTLKKQGLSFVDIKRICDAMDAELCIEIKKKEDIEKANAEKLALEAQIAELQAKLKNI